jgi:virginiamycin B lyase
VTIYHDPTIDSPRDITAGPDGALWFTNYGDHCRTVCGSIGRITTRGKVTNFDPTINFYCGGAACGTAITSGPDGALWYTAVSDGIARITTRGRVTKHAAPGLTWDLTTGADGALWFTNTGASSIGRMTTGGHVNDFSDPRIGSPLNIVTGPDGAMWFTDATNEQIGRVTTAVSS